MKKQKSECTKCKCKKCNEEAEALKKYPEEYTADYKGRDKKGHHIFTNRRPLK